MQRIYPKFLLSAISPDHFPAPTIPEIAFLGRSNVGKSSLLNALLGSKQAHVSSTPGRTRAINFFAIMDSPQRQQPQMYFADLPGYGYAKLSKSISAEWPKFIEPYLSDRPTLALCLCLVDSNIPPQKKRRPAHPVSKVIRPPTPGPGNESRSPLRQCPSQSPGRVTQRIGSRRIAALFFQDRSGTKRGMERHPNCGRRDVKRNHQLE